MASLARRVIRAKSVKPGRITPRSPDCIPKHIPLPPYVEESCSTGIPPPAPPYVPRMALGSPELDCMRDACRLARRMLDLACSLAKPNTTTNEIDAEVHQAIIDAGAYPSPLNYHGFPKSLCSSVNEVVCHAIPDDRPLEDGDIVSLDVSCYLNGFHGDNCATVAVGKGDKGAYRLIKACKEALQAGISVCKSGNCLTQIGSAVEDVASSYGYESVQAYCGHGIGHQVFHALPFVQHFRNTDVLKLEPGFIFTIEPSLTEGSQDTEIWPDKWTVATRDGGRSAQFEHVILITDDGCEILTVNE